jgi:hypothetical protein
MDLESVARFAGVFPQYENCESRAALRRNSLPTRCCQLRHRFDDGACAANPVRSFVSSSEREQVGNGRTLAF